MYKKLRTPVAAILLIIISFFMMSSIVSFFDQLKYGAPLFTMLFRNYIFVFLRLAVNIAICIALFAKKRNNSLVVILGCAALLNFIILIRAIRIINFLNFAAYALLLVNAISFCDQSLIKADMSKIREFSKKFYFLPAVAYLAANIISWARLFGQEDYFIPFRIVIRHIFRYPLRIGNIPGVNIVSGILGAIVLLSIALWLIDPYSKAAKLREGSNGRSYAGAEYSEAYCPLGKHIVLTLVTCGVWYYMWIYKTTRYLNKAPGAQQYVPVKKLLLCLFVPYYYIYWFCKHARRLTDLSNATNPRFADQNTMYIIFGIFVPVVSCILMQVRINHLELGTLPGAEAPAAPSASATPAATAASDTPASSEHDTVQALRSYKELLDMGAITQEEFDTKKKQLLGL